MDRVMMEYRRRARLHKDAFQQTFKANLDDFSVANGFHLERFLVFLDCSVECLESEVLKRYGSIGLHLLRTLSMLDIKSVQKKEA